MTDAERIVILQRMVDAFPGDVAALQSAVCDGRTPEPARRSLAAALLYVVDRFDLVPDHIEGLGLADDAAVLRLAAKHAVSHGADDLALRRIAAEAADLEDVYADLLAPLEAYLERRKGRPLDGKTPAEIIDDPESRMKLWQELSRCLITHRPQRVSVADGDPSLTLKVLRNLLRGRLERAAAGS